MKLLVDVGVGEAVEQWLASQGIDVLAVRDLDPSMADDAILELAVTQREHLTQALEERLASDLTLPAEGSNLLALTARADPVLAELWANEKDAAYDRL